MPQVSGYQFLEDLKKDNRTRNIPVIIVSAVSGKESKTKTRDLGAIDYIEKPINIKVLIQKVEAILN